MFSDFVPRGPFVNGPYGVGAGTRAVGDAGPLQNRGRFVNRPYAMRYLPGAGRYYLGAMHYPLTAPLVMPAMICS